MTQRITLSDVHGAFKRLTVAMGWSEMNTCRPYLVDRSYVFVVEQMPNKGDGVHTLLGPWGTKRDAVEGMIAMAQAVELFKRAQSDSLAA